MGLIIYWDSLRALIEVLPPLKARCISCLMMLYNWVRTQAVAGSTTGRFFAFYLKWKELQQITHILLKCMPTI
jgi:hypothetical protein